MATRIKSPYPLLPISDAQAIVERETRALPTQLVPLSEALGRTLAESVHAKDDLPPFPASIKDGYAVVASDGTGTFPIAGEARAGAASDLTLESGRVAYITTGAPVPSGADAVIQVEDTEREPGSDSVTILKAAQPGQDIRDVGSDIKEGQLCLEAGDDIGAAECGILATVGAHQVPVHRQPVVAVLSTGDEVVEPSCEAVGPGQIRDSNRVMLIAACREAGARVVDLGIARDQAGHLEGCVQRALDADADVIITSGGVSMGDKDLVKPLMERSGKVHFGRVLMKPGKPLTFATMDLDESRRVLFFGLPGNPVSSIVCFHLVVRLALNKLAGKAAPGLRSVAVRVPNAIKLDRERPEYHRVTVTWKGSDSNGEPQFEALSTGNQRSSRLLSVRSSNGLLELPAGSKDQSEIAAGTLVPCLLIGDLRRMPC